MIKLRLFFRGKLLEFVGFLIFNLWKEEKPSKLVIRLQRIHAVLLAKQMIDRKAAGKVELQMGVFEMTEEELNEYGKRF